MNWSAADINQAQRRQTEPVAAPKPPRRVEVAEKQKEAAVAAVMSSAAKQYYVGPYQLAVANGTHYPGRSRVVIVGPASEALTAALVAAVESFNAKQAQP
jgi:hypothetical protein